MRTGGPRTRRRDYGWNSWGHSRPTHRNTVTEVLPHRPLAARLIASAEIARDTSLKPGSGPNTGAGFGR